MMKHEFLERVNNIRAHKGYDPITNISAEDYATVEYVYTWHPAFDVPDAKDAIAEVYTIQCAVCNGMFLIRSMVEGAKQAEMLESRRNELRHQISALQTEMESINAQMRKIRDGEK